MTVGNFGPEGAKQWDVIGVPVIKAKRMESTAPVGGYRISEELFEILDAEQFTIIKLEENKTFYRVILEKKGPDSTD